jgi:hypothetical protein
MLSDTSIFILVLLLQPAAIGPALTSADRQIGMAFLSDRPRAITYGVDSQEADGAVSRPAGRAARNNVASGW